MSKIDWRVFWESLKQDLPKVLWTFALAIIQEAIRRGFGGGGLGACPVRA